MIIAAKPPWKKEDLILDKKEDQKETFLEDLEEFWKTYLVKKKTKKMPAAGEFFGNFVFLVIFVPKFGIFADNFSNWKKEDFCLVKKGLWETLEDLGGFGRAKRRPKKVFQKKKTFWQLWLW